MSHFDYMEGQGQLNIFDLEQEHYVGKEVKIYMTKLNEESKNYFKFYFPNVIGAKGIITEIRGSQAEVEIDGKKFGFNLEELN